MFNKTLSRALVFVLFSTVLAIFTPAYAESWNAYTYIPTTNITAGAAIKKIADEITRQTDGKLKIRLHLGGSLPIKATNITQAVSRGATIQLADDGFPYGNIPIAGILNLPMLLTDEQDFDTAIKILKPYLDKAFADKGIVILGIYHYPLQSSWSGNKKLTDLGDLSGLKMRVTSPQQAAFVRAFNGTPVTIGTPEVAPALQRGVVDGVFTASTGGGRIWVDQLHYHYKLGPNYFASFVTANKSAFDRLDSGTQEIIRNVVNKVGVWATNTMKEQEAKVDQEMAKNGMIVTDAKQSDIDEGAKRMAPYWKQWTKEQGPTAEAALQKIRAAIHR